MKESARHEDRYGLDLVLAFASPRSGGEGKTSVLSCRVGRAVSMEVTIRRPVGWSSRLPPVFLRTFRICNQAVRCRSSTQRWAGFGAPAQLDDGQCRCGDRIGRQADAEADGTVRAACDANGMDHCRRRSRLSPWREAAPRPA